MRNLSLWLLCLGIAGTLTLTACGDDGGGDGEDGNNAANNTPANNTPANNTPANNTPANNTPANNTPANNTPANNTPANNTPANNTPANNAPANNAPGEYSCDYMPSGNYVKPDEDACNLIAQDCPEGQGCFPSADGVACFGVGEATCGGPCNAANDCAPGQVCAGDPAICLALCESGTTCPDGSMCGGLQDRDDVGVCVPPIEAVGCDVLNPNCADGEGCYLVNGEQECAPPTPDAAARGEACEFANDCQPGLICLGATADDLSCLAPCATDGSVQCDAGTCTPLQGFDTLGVCVE